MELLANIFLPQIINQISPLQARGVKLRVNNVGIGKRRDFELRRERGWTRLNWISGEIFFSEEVKEHLNIGRDDFVSNAVTDEIFDFFAAKLRDAANEVEVVAVFEQVSGNTKSTQASKSRKEVIESDLKRLENKGYQIIYNQNDQPTLIDKSAKKI